MHWQQVLDATREISHAYPTNTAYAWQMRSRAFRFKMSLSHSPHINCIDVSLICQYFQHNADDATPECYRLGEHILHMPRASSLARKFTATWGIDASA